MMKRILIFTSSTLLTTLSFANLPAAFQDYHNGLYQKAATSLPEIKGKAKGQAEYYLAKMLLRGYGVKKDFNAAIEKMTSAAELKYVPAEMFLGQYYLQKKHDLPEAIKWFKKAANANNSKAQLFVGMAYLNGYGVKKNTDIARKYIIGAAKNGFPMAQYELAHMFLNSKHKSDRKMGKIWLKKAANKGNADAEYLLGTLL